jgi:catechol 2,3-dioxygenase
MSISPDKISQDQSLLKELEQYTRSIAHLGHVEIGVTNLEKSLWFFTEVMGLYVSDQEDDRVYLRAWQDFDHHTLILKQSETSGVKQVGWRVSSEKALEAFEKQFKDMGIDHKLIKAGEKKAQGDSIQFKSPAGLPVELYWEKELYVNTNPAIASKLPSHPSKYTGKGVAPRRFDHVNFMVDDVEKEQQWWSDLLGIHHRYYVQNQDDVRIGSWLSRTNIAHEIALMRNANQDGALFHHLAYYLDSPDELIRAANLMAENDIKIEWGPGKHGTSGAQFIYVIEPSGNRVEIWTGGFLIFAPDWEPIEWSPEVGLLGLDLWGSIAPESYFKYGTKLL